MKFDEYDYIIVGILNLIAIWGTALWKTAWPMVIVFAGSLGYWKMKNNNDKS
tara:strand:+ start:1116 stop:1271 length:156 start_codon:yes stop_codon:yes gene_type:complete